MLILRVQDALDTRTGFPIKPYKTPPYSTAKPDVVSTPLRRDNGEEIKFIIMGTDGREWENEILETAFLTSSLGANVARRGLSADRGSAWSCRSTARRANSKVPPDCYDPIRAAPATSSVAAS